LPIDSLCEVRKSVKDWLAAQSAEIRKINRQQKTLQKKRFPKKTKSVVLVYNSTKNFTHILKLQLG
jgi:hypothetical protein